MHVYVLALLSIGSTLGSPTNQIREIRGLGPIPVSEGVARVEDAQWNYPSENSTSLVIIESQPMVSDYDNIIYDEEDEPNQPAHSPPYWEERAQPAPNPKKESVRFCEAGFSVRKAVKNTLEAPTKVHFQDVITNAGGWDSKQSAFIPKCAGTYFFTFHGLSYKSDFTLALMKNDDYQVTAYGTKQNYESGSNSVLLFLNPGDAIYLQLQQGSLYEHPYEEAYNTFSGFLVNKF